MESTIAWLVGEFENGKISRRKLVQTLAMVAVGAPIAAAAASTPLGTPAITVPTAPWKTVWLDHISYQVSDYKRSVDFYTSLMGWRVTADTGTQATLDINGIGGIIIRNAPRAGPAKGAAPDTTPVPPITGTIDHMSWGVAPWDTDAVRGELEKRHLDPTPDMVGADFKSFLVKDPDGWELQISNQTKPKDK